MNYKEVKRDLKSYINEVRELKGEDIIQLDDDIVGDYIALWLYNYIGYTYINDPNGEAEKEKSDFLEMIPYLGLKTVLNGTSWKMLDIFNLEFFHRNMLIIYNNINYYLNY